MPERIEYEPKLIVDRDLKTPIDLFRAAGFATGAALSAHVASGLLLKQVSSEVKIRPLNIEMYNRNANWVCIEYRDGGMSGGRVLGPYVINTTSERRIGYDEIVGAYFTSGAYMCVISGAVSQGVVGSIRYVQEALDIRE